MSDAYEGVMHRLGHTYTFLIVTQLFPKKVPTVTVSKIFSAQQVVGGDLEEVGDLGQ